MAVHLQQFPVKRETQESGFILLIVQQLRGMPVKQESNTDLPLKMQKEMNQISHGLRIM